jgi:hypothetical protein
MADGGSAELGPVVLPLTNLDAPELGGTICARVAAGESLAAVCREPDMPCATTVRAWAAASPGFGEALREAFRQARVARRLADWRRAQALAAQPPPPKRRPLLYSTKLGETICERLAEGRSLSSIVGDPDMPSYRSVMNWARLIPEFADMYAQARQIQADYLFDEARDVAQAATAGSVWVSRLQFDVIRWQAARLAPRKYCERVVVAQELAAPPERPLQIQVVSFRKGPNGEVLVAPPRNEDEEQRWRRAYGAPYDGPR